MTAAYLPLHIAIWKAFSTTALLAGLWAGFFLNPKYTPSRNRASGEARDPAQIESEIERKALCRSVSVGSWVWVK